MKSIIEQGPSIVEAYDASTGQAHAYFIKVKEWLENQTDSLEEVDRKARDFGDTALAFRIMLKFIESERVIQNLTDPVTLSLINPVYKETGRLQTREEHPHGENSLRMKILTLQYFEGLNPNFKGRVYLG